MSERTKPSILLPLPHVAAGCTRPGTHRECGRERRGPEAPVGHWHGGMGLRDFVGDDGKLYRDRRGGARGERLRPSPAYPQGPPTASPVGQDTRAALVEALDRAQVRAARLRMIALKMISQNYGLDTVHAGYFLEGWLNDPSAVWE